MKIKCVNKSSGSLERIFDTFLLNLFAYVKMTGLKKVT